MTERCEMKYDEWCDEQTRWSGELTTLGWAMEADSTDSW